MGLTLALALAVASSVAYAAGAVLQERLALVTGTSRGWRWVLAVSLNLAGAGLHVLALRFGPLSVIQSLGALTLVFALPASAALAQRRVRGQEWRGAVLVLIGLAGIVGLTRSPAQTRALTDPQLVLVLVVTATALAGLAVSAGLSNTPVRTSFFYAVAAGMAFGVASAMTQTAAVHLADEGLPAVGDPVVVLTVLAVVALAGAGLLFAQASYRAGLGAQLATATMVNAVSATVIGVALLGQSYAGGAVGVLLALAATTLAGVGIFQLAGSTGRPVVHGP